ncbi:MAG: c-type cytochrome [Nitrospirae bacterium]|nr:c-type cytochrome [Nitrospirota bacterium]
MPKDAYEVKVEGFMWGWDITYPDGTKTTNELRVPEGVPIKVNLTARDVLHAFYIPEYRVQEEAIPGRTTYFWFNPTKAGESRAYCTEFCGNGHSVMLAKVIVMEKEKFQAWLSEQKGAAAGMPTAERGAKLIEDLGCTMCHSTTGEEGGGPTFKGIFGRKTLLTDGKTIIVDDSYIKTSILSPKDNLVKGFDPVMQAYKLPDNDIKAITEYLKALK